LLRDRLPPRVAEPYAAAIPERISERAGVSFDGIREVRNRSDMDQPSGDAWRGDGTGAGCFNDVVAVQPGAARLALIACVTTNS
jgi:hypothetical protein